VFNALNSTGGVLGESYIVLCVTVHKKYIPVMLLTAYRAAGLRVNVLKGNIEMDMKEMALITSGLNMFNILS
jgi:hypothetical protein